MKQDQPTPQEWRALYEAAAEFRKIEPWRWMDDSDIFGVQDPHSGEIGYCCIMGGLGEVFAMAVYLGTEGLNGYRLIQKGTVKPGDPDSLFIQNCLMASFEDREFIEEEDMAVIKALGLKFRGSNGWPLFRSYKPGYFPWFLGRDEALYLTAALQQAHYVCVRYKEDRKMLRPARKNHYLVRVQGTVDNATDWHDEWKEPAPAKSEPIESKPVDELRIQRIKKTAKPVQAVWEIDFFYTPTPVAEGGRPFFPYAMMICDHNSGFIYDIYLSSPRKYIAEFPTVFLSSIEKNGITPMEILVSKKEAADLLAPYALSFDIKVSSAKRLNNIDNARRGMTEFLERI